MLRSALVALPALSAAMLAGPALAQDRGTPLSTCGDQEHVASYLRDNFNEVPVSLGLQADGRMLQVFASEESGTWTMVTTSPNGTTCIIGAGEAWQNMPRGQLADALGRDPVRPRS